MYGIFQTLVFSVLLTTALYFLPNNSNLRKEYILPFIVALLTKYVLGDWDDGYIWSYSDVYYWASVLLVSYITVIGMNELFL
jgi:hypothetical protein